MPEIGNKVWMNVLMAGAAVAAVATAVVVWQRIQKTQPVQTRNQSLGLLNEFQHAAATPLHALRQIADHMATEMHAGLMTEGKSNLLMLPTFVENLPDGTEEGLFYALDLGGTNFRVLRCLIGGKEGRVLKQEYEEVPIPKSLMLGTSEELFDFIAKRLVDFVGREGDEFRVKNKQKQQVRELGLTFSFPVKQLSVKSGILIQWSKGFKIADGVGADVVALLQSAINRQHGPKIEVSVLVNDTVGTLAGGRYWNDDVMVGMILGTGTNACYVERDLPSHAPSKTGEMVINMEWGGFWSSHLPRTYADEQLDNESVNPGQAGYEKMIGGMYLGEIVRRVLLRMAREASLFGGPVPAKLREPFILITPEMSKMHGDESGDLRVVAKILRDVFGVQETELPARRIVHDVCDIVTMRSARLAAAGIVGILKKVMPDAFDSGTSGALKTLHRDSRVGRKGENGKIVVAMDGGLYEHYTQYRMYMQAAVNELLSEAQAKRLVIQLSKDGSGIGATILAACHSQYRESAGKAFEHNDTSYAKHEKMVRFGDAHPNATRSQFTQYESKPTNTQSTQYEPKPTNTQSTQYEPKPTNTQSTQYESKPTNTQSTQYESKPTNTQSTQCDRSNLCSSGAQSDRPNLCSSQSQTDMLNCQPAAQHSISYIYGLNIF